MAPSIAHWVQNGFLNSDALVFVGAVGIAVRLIAPYIQNKMQDPAVVVLDEKANFAVSLLSGHVGGANALCRRLAALCGAQAVITTATDINGVFAVDSWAKAHNMAIVNPQEIKTVSCALLNAQTVGLQSDFEIEGALPQGMLLAPVKPKVAVSVRRQTEKRYAGTWPRAL